MKRRVSTTGRLFAVGAAFLFAAGLSPTSAGAQEVAGSVEVADHGTLLAKGAAASVTFTVTCFGETGRFLDVELTQAHGNSVTRGHEFILVQCDGTTQDVVVMLDANPGPFRKGPAFIEAAMYTCSETTCGYIGDKEVISLGR